ncbi:MAG: M48 family metallopeptidase [Candidatus Bathyarchaeia archaeon]
MVSASEFKKEVSNWAQELNVTPKEVHLRDISNKWASCSSKGRLTFSYALLNETDENRSKVIVHELLHLKYPNHGKMFKTLYNSYLKKAGINCSINDISFAKTA